MARAVAAPPSATRAAVDDDDDGATRDDDDARDGATRGTTRATATDGDGDGDGDDVNDGDEFEEYEVEVDYELRDYVDDARASLARLRPDFTWGACEARARARAEAGVMGYASAAASSGAAASERLDAHSAVGTAVALGALWSARAIRICLLYTSPSPRDRG